MKINPSRMWLSFVALTASVVMTFADTAEKIVTSPSDSIVGLVIDAVSKQPLAGAQIQTSDPRVTAMSDENGRFVLRLTSPVSTMYFNAPGYDRKDLPIFKAIRTVTVKLLPELTGSYYAQEIGNFGNVRKASVATSMRSFELDNQSSVSIDAELKKKMAGDIKLTTFSGSPVAGSMMMIRGVNSLNASNSPLIVVDGVIIDNQTIRSSLHLGNNLNPLSGIDVSDIQSISVLKDGTSMYGSKGGNGVILITTNRGRSMATRISVTSILGYTQQPSMIPMMDADQYRIYLSDLIKSPEAQNIPSDQFFLNTDPNFIYYNKYHNRTNWADGIYRGATTQSYNVAVNGGDDIALYNLSIGLTNSLSTLQSNDFNRVNARFNSDINLSDKLKTAFDISYLQIARKLRNDGVAENYRSQVNSPGYLALIKSPFLSPYQYSNTRELTSKIEDYDFLKVANPYAILEYGSGYSQQTQFNLALVPTYKLSNNWNVSSRFSYSLVNLSENMYSPMYGVAPFIDSDNKMESKNHVKTQFARQNSILSDTRVNWKKQAGSHAFDVNAGVRYMYDAYISEYAEGHNTGSDQIREMSGTLQFKTVEGIDEPYKQLGYYGVASYSLREKYFAEAAMAVETSSRFGATPASGFNILGVGWAVFPSINAAWLISSEEFMKDLSFVNSMKLRAGIGMSGNDGIESTAARTYFQAVKYYNNATGIELKNIANPLIQWETVTKRNLGLDATLFGDRMTFSVDVYNNTTDNLLVMKQMEPYSGIGMFWTNDGKLENKGLEFGFDARLIRTSDFNLSIGASIASNKNRVVRLTDGDYITTAYGAEILTAVDQPFGQFYGYQTNGVLTSAADATAENLRMMDKTGAYVNFEAGDVRFVDQNDDNIIDDHDKVVLGNSNPDYFGGMNLAMNYKNVGLKVHVNYTYGNEIYNYLRSQLESGSSFNNQSVGLVNRWIVDGQNTSIPRSVYGDPKMNNRFSDRWVEDGSYLRLGLIELSYELPVSKVKFLQGVTLWASANNLLTITNYLGVDPEFSVGSNLFYQGIDTGMLPLSKSFNAGLKIYL
jgi:TonB-linked SusC/RagA family outer membrane protein